MFTGKTILAALESATITGLSTFAATVELTNGTVTVKGVIAAATAAGIAALYSFTKSLGAVQFKAGKSPVA